jgi:hypothetical protein
VTIFTVGRPWNNESYWYFPYLQLNQDKLRYVPQAYYNFLDYQRDVFQHQFYSNAIQIDGEGALDALNALMPYGNLQVHGLLDPSHHTILSHAFKRNTKSLSGVRTYYGFLPTAKLRYDSGALSYISTVDATAQEDEIKPTDVFDNFTFLECLPAGAAWRYAVCDYLQRKFSSLPSNVLIVDIGAGDNAFYSLAIPQRHLYYGFDPLLNTLSRDVNAVGFRRLFTMDDLLQLTANYSIEYHSDIVKTPMKQKPTAIYFLLMFSAHMLDKELLSSILKFATEGHLFYGGARLAHSGNNSYTGEIKPVPGLDDLEREIHLSPKFCLCDYDEWVDKTNKDVFCNY